MYNGQGFSFWQFNGMTSGGVVTDTTQPVNVGSPYDNPRAEFLITSQDFFCSTGCNGLTIWAISNPFGFVTGGPSPELSGVVIGTVNNYSQPPNAVQPGTSTLIDTNDTRISGEATYQSGSIYASNKSANGTGGVASLIYRVQPDLTVNDGARCTGAFLNLCPQITGATELNESILNYGGTTAAYFAVPQPDLEGNVNTVFTYSSTTAYASLAYISQRVTQGNNIFVDAGFFLQSGSAPAYTQGRWGDYNAVAPAGVFYASGNGGLVATPGFGFSGMYASAVAHYLRLHLAHQNRVQQVQRAWPAVSAVQGKSQSALVEGKEQRGDFQRRRGIAIRGAMPRPMISCGSQTAHSPP